MGIIKMGKDKIFRTTCTYCKETVEADFTEIG